MTEGKDEDWTKAMRCVLEGYLECAAKVPEACLCRKMPLAEIEKAQQALAKSLEMATMEAMLGGPPRKQRQTALRMGASGLETIDLDDAGNVIEPVRCTCGRYAILHRAGCPFAYGVT